MHCDIFSIYEANICFKQIRRIDVKKAKNSQLISESPLVPKKSVSTRFVRYMKRLIKQWPLLALCIPALTLIIIFKYVPIYGVLIAFKNYRPNRGVWDSAWLTPFYQNFQRFFEDPNSWSIIWNTLKVGLVTLVFTYPAPIIFALLLNEIRTKWFKRTVQTVSYIPYFISVVVVVGMLTEFGSVGGLFNQIRELFGMTAINMNQGSEYFLTMYIGSAIWQGMGYGAIIYLAALANVDTSLYDVANIDGANRWQKVKHICLPAILPTTTVLLILNTGNILSQDFTKILLMQNDSNRSMLDVISTFVYRNGIVQGQFSYTTAVNLLISIVSLILVFSTNMVVRKTSPENSLF